MLVSELGFVWVLKGQNCRIRRCACLQGTERSASRSLVPRWARYKTPHQPETPDLTAISPLSPPVSNGLCGVNVPKRLGGGHSRLDLRPASGQGCGWWDHVEGSDYSQRSHSPPYFTSAAFKQKPNVDTICWPATGNECLCAR